MSPSDWQRVWQRWFAWGDAFDHPVVIGVTVAAAVLLVVAGGMIQWLRWSGKIGPEGYRDVYLRWRSWIVVSVFTIVPTLLGAAWTMAAVAFLSLACYYEFARATGMLGERILNAVVVGGICLVTFAVADHYDRLFFASVALTAVLLAVITIPADRPQGYVRRVALAMFGFLLFGFCLGYMGNFANVADLGNGADYRPLLLTIILAVAMNDILAYCVGKAFGRTKLLPNTSPGKTVAGTLGALVLASSIIALLFHFVLRGTPADRLSVLVTLGIGISVLGQLGDLVISSIKRDVGIKDIGTILPGHGGLLDRFDSLILVPPVVFHYLSLQLGPLAAGEPARIFSGR
ncbi:MAG: phosphatidate cytidylyltransferase [Thermoguttaceae bacterium]